MDKTIAHTPDPDDPATLSEADFAFLDSLPDETTEAAARSDPDNLPVTETMVSRARTAHLVRRTRAGTGLSQSKFATRYGFSAAAVRDWEQGRRTPEASTLCYLRVIEHEPQAVERALAMIRSSPRVSRHRRRNRPSLDKWRNA